VAVYLRANRHTTKLDGIDVKFMRHWRKLGYAVKDIADAFWINPTYAGQVCNGTARRST